MRHWLGWAAAFFAAVSAWMIYVDLANPTAPSRPLGLVWFENAPGSLQISEAIISRYLDVCSLIDALGCSPFLWHPLISTMLGWPAALFFSVLTALLFIISRFFKKTNKGGRKGVKALRREGRP